MEVALALLQALADPTPALQRADKQGGAGRARLKALLHSTVFKARAAPPADVNVGHHAL